MEVHAKVPRWSDEQMERVKEKVKRSRVDWRVSAYGEDQIRWIRWRSKVTKGFKSEELEIDTLVNWKPMEQFKKRCYTFRHLGQDIILEAAPLVYSKLMEVYGEIYGEGTWRFDNMA